MNRQEINEAIKKVLGTQFKKDAPEAFKIVKEAGYTTYKDRGYFYNVANPKTGKVLRTRNYGMDYVAFLEKPINMDWQYVQNTKKNPRPIGEARGRYIGIHWYKSDLERHDRRIASLKEDIADYMKRIERLQNDILNEMISKQEAEQLLEEERAKVREEFGLKKGA